MWPWRVKMPTQNLLRLFLLLMLMLRITLATVCYRFGSWCLVLKLNFFQTLSTRFGNGFEVEVQARFWSWSFSSSLPLMLQIWELMFGPKAKLLFRLWTQGLVKISKLKFRQDYEAWVCSAFCRWCFVEVMKLNLGRDFEARFGQDFEFLVLWRCWCLVEIFSWCLDGILKMKCAQDLCLNLW